MQHIVDTAGGHLLISTHVGACLAIFGVAHDSIILAEARIRQKLPPGVLGDELGRFKLWCGNVGAHRKGRGSLDYKLREASHIRNQIVELLQSMCLIVKEAVGILKGDRVPWEDFSDSDSDTSEAPNERYPEQQTTTELTQLLRNIAEINTCLMRLAMAIRNPAPHDRFKESAHIDVSYFESFDIDHVRGKFPMAQEYLVLRLGKAISRRRQYLRYREEHRNKYEQGLMLYLHVETADASHPIPQTVAPSEHIESTVASSLPLAIKSSATALELVEDDLYEDTLSQTSYASSAQDSARLRPPPLPSAGQSGEPFECPLCFRFTSVRQLAAWYKHVYRDLQPYMCTAEGCEIADRTYESRHEWFHHELQVHHRWWECVGGCNRSFHSVDEIRAHSWRDHVNLANEERINDLIRNCERHHSMSTKAECPLCHAQLPSYTSLRRHLGKHLEELALFCVAVASKRGSRG